MYCAIHWIEIYPVYSAIHPSNNRGLMYSEAVPFYNKWNNISVYTQGTKQYYLIHIGTGIKNYYSLIGSDSKNRKKIMKIITMIKKLPGISVNRQNIQWVHDFANTESMITCRKSMFRPEDDVNST